MVNGPPGVSALQDKLMFTVPLIFNAPAHIQNRAARASKSSVLNCNEAPEATVKLFTASACPALATVMPSAALLLTL